MNRLSPYIIAAFLLLDAGNFHILAQSGDGVAPDTSYIQMLLSEARHFQSVSKFDSTLIVANRADSLSEDIGYNRGLITASIIRSETYLERQEIDAANEILEQAIERFPESNQIGKLYKLKGEVLFHQGDITEALPIFLQAAKMAELLPDSSRDSFLATLHQSLGNTYSSIGDMPKGFENYLKAIEFAEANADTAFLTLLYNNVGTTYSHNQEFEKSQYYLEKSLESARQINSRIDIYRAHLNLGNTLRDMGEYEQALEHYEQAQDLWTELRPNVPPAIILHNQGATLRNLERYDEAEELLFRSLELSQDIQLPQGIYFNHLELSRLYQQIGRLDDAVYHIEQAMPLAEGSGSLTTLNAAQQQMHQVYAEAGRYEQAYEVLIDNRALTDSLSTIEKEKELSQLESSLELNRQQEVNELLEEKQVQQEQQIRTQHILILAAVLIIILIAALLMMARKTAREKQQLLDELQARKKELEEINQAKDRVFAIVSHDLRSPLTAVQGVLELVQDEILKGDELKDLVKDINISLRENVDVIEDLLEWAKKQLTGFDLEMEPVLLKPIIDDVITGHSFIAIQKEVTLTSNLGDEKVYADVNALRVIFRNLISNAIKYTERGDTVEISIKMNDESLIISVEDNGIGIPTDAAKKIFNSNTWTRVGTQKEKGSGFGLSISKEFTEQMNGRIWFESEEGAGTTFFVELPKPS